MLYTIEDIKDVHKGNWFDEDTLSWWGSYVYGYVHSDDKGGAYFISSEDNFDRTLKLFSVRHCTKDGKISTPSWQEHVSWNEAKAEIGYITSFQWKRDVPIWVVLKFMAYREAMQFDTHYMTGWKATPKGGKLTTYDSHFGVVTNQYYK